MYLFPVELISYKQYTALESKSDDSFEEMFADLKIMPFPIKLVYAEPILVLNP